MTDALTTHEVDEDQDDRRDSDGRGVWNVLAIAAVVVIVILALMMLRGCSSIMDAASHSSETNHIVPVTGGLPVSGKVSLWLAPGGGITQVLSANGLTGAVVDLGSGRYVVDVPSGDEVEAVRQLRDTQNVYDAGRVYRDKGE